MKPNTYPFPSRPNVDMAQPDSEPLSPTELDKLRRFEERLAAVNLNTEQYPETCRVATSADLPPIAELNNNHSDSAKLYVAYLQTDEGRNGLFQLVGTEEDKEAELATVNWAKVDTEDVKKLAGQSREYARNRFIEQYQQGIEPDESLLAGFYAYYHDPHQLQAYLQSLQSWRHYLRDATHDLRINHDPAASFVVSLYRQKINAKLDELYPDIYTFVAQAEQGSNPELLEIAQTMRELIPQTHLTTAGRAMVTFDHFRYGVEPDPETGRRQVLSSGALELADHPEAQTLPAAEPLFTQDQYEALAAIDYDAQAVRSLIENVLEAYDLLSVEEDDGKWTVQISSKAGSMSVSGPKRRLTIPQKSSRSLADVMPIVCHEVVHVIQHHNKRYLPLKILQELGGDRASVVFEGGGIAWERQAKEELFGQNRPVNTSYLRAIQTRLSGGSFTDCFKTVLDTKLAQDPAADFTKTARRAFGSTMRLFARGGQFTKNGQLASSKALHYLESELVARTQTDPRFFLIGSINPATFAELLSIGLIDEDFFERIFIPEQTPWHLLAPELKSLLAA